MYCAVEMVNAVVDVRAAKKLHDFLCHTTLPGIESMIFILIFKIKSCQTSKLLPRFSDLSGELTDVSNCS